MVTQKQLPTDNYTTNDDNALDAQATVTTVTQGSQVDMLQAPTGISIPDFLEKFIAKIDNPSVIQDDDEMYTEFLIKLGKDALAAKIADIENYNLAIKVGKKRIPDKLDFEEVAILMMSIYKFWNIQMTEREEDTILAMYDAKKGTYVSSIKKLFSFMDRIAPKFKVKDMEDVIDKIERSVPTVEQTKERHLFPVKNGIYNQRSQKLEPFSSDYVFMTKIPVEYTPNPVNPVITMPDGEKWDVDSWVEDIMNNDPDSVKLIWQVIADCLQPNHSRHKSIWFYSNKGNNGKGTVGQLVKNLLGKGNYASLSVEDFNHEFLKETLLNTAANIADENDVNIYIDSIKDYKASVTGDDINVNRKYEKPLRIQYLGTNIQMMNGLPKTKDKSDSFYRRIILVPFMKSFTNNGERKYIKDDYINRQEVLEYVLNKALNIDFEEYIIPAASADLMKEYREDNDPVLEFWNDYKDQFVWDLLPSDFLFKGFQNWSSDNNPKGSGITKQTFLKQIRDAIVLQGDGWIDKTSREGSGARTGQRMDADEPLLTEFGLDIPNRDGKPNEWMKTNYKGTNVQTRRDFSRRPSYRGFLRA